MLNNATGCYGDRLRHRHHVRHHRQKAVRRYRIQGNLQETAINLHGQGTKLVNAQDRMDIALNKIEENNDVLGDIACSKKCQKLWMIIVNILLFSIIVLIILMKILNLFK